MSEFMERRSESDHENKTRPRGDLLFFTEEKS
jgi:hypothetical protein